MEIDGVFHLSRIYEIVQQIKHGQLFPDVSYFTFNNHGYAIHFFYPYISNYLNALIWFLTSNAMISFLISHAIYFLIGLMVAYDACYTWRKNEKTAFVFSLLYVLGSHNAMKGMMTLLGYSNQIAYMVLPYIVLGVPYIIMKQSREWTARVLLGVVFIAFTHLLTLYISVGYAGIWLIAFIIKCRDKLTVKTIGVWIRLLVKIMLCITIIIFPLIEQRVSNDWLPRPFINWEYRSIIQSSTQSIWSRLSDAFNGRESTLLLLIFFCGVAFKYKLFSRHIKLLCLIIVGVMLFQSDFVPWYVLARISFIDVIQFLSRFTFFLIFAISLCIALIIEEYSQLNGKYWKITFGILMLLLLTNFNVQRKVFFMSNFSKSEQVSVMNNQRIREALEYTNVHFYPWKYNVPYWLNGFMDYRTKNQLRRTFDESNKYQIHMNRFHVKNGDSFAPLNGIDKNQMIETSDFVENSVYFDGQRQLKVFSQKGLAFYIKDIPKQTKVVRTPITYLKGFVIKDEQGLVLNSYRDKDGWLAFDSNGTSKVTITYEKTLAHKTSIIVSGISVLSLVASYTIRKIKYRKNG